MLMMSMRLANPSCFRTLGLFNHVLIAISLVLTQAASQSQKDTLKGTFELTKSVSRKRAVFSCFEFFARVGVKYSNFS